MGMYTEFHFNAELNNNTPPEVLTLLRFMLEAGPSETPPQPLPEHALFKTERWHVMLRMDSYYFAAQTRSELIHDTAGSGTYFLCIRCNLKNYGGEIEAFVDWITRYVDAFEGEFLGFSRYEESDDPKLIHMGRPRAALGTADSKALADALIDPPAPSEELRAAAERYTTKREQQ